METTRYREMEREMNTIYIYMYIYIYICGHPLPMIASPLESAANYDVLLRFQNVGCWLFFAWAR